ncbi:ribosomal protein L7/L12 [Stappia aggregata IAM 12614]|uniref:Ribosomal protein L7/L12 n=1 Tax=Roseibium aggregatum (strain ATCC 25650 / DSM 13394 / JCM 20685 / NBRC 16684 / NCIMB 2208 / IAM 12614 / B1) TaxID=384765 RepID=A0NWJ7_ROSAI|nr:ribosomal protein L7/L12 [Stappia aggregata IAM 12614] [Roseibium aggregatum IAM 12614]
MTGFGAPSTSSLASFRPRPVIARTSLMTLIFLSPAEARITSNSVFSSAAAASPPPAATAATATGAAAETPHFSSRSLLSSAASITVSADSSSTSFSRSAIFQYLKFEPVLVT